MTALLLTDVNHFALPSLSAYREQMNFSRHLRSVPAATPQVDSAAASTTGAATKVHVATALMARVQLGDRDAFALLYDELAALIYGVVLRVVRDPSISEEVSQEIFMEIWKTANRFDSNKGSINTWAATIAHRRAVDRVRSVESARRRDQADADVQPLEIEGVDTEVVSKMESARVRAALAVLSDKQRAAIELAYFDGLSYREVGEALDLPEGTVKSRIRDGMNRLRIELQGAST